MDDSTNPYASPRVEEAVEVATTAQTQGPPSFSLLVSWCLICLMNTPVCILFAAELLTPSGFPGMASGVLIVMTGVGWFAYRHTVFAKVAVRGGFLFALTQFFPILQMFTGMFAVSITMSLMGNQQGLNSAPVLSFLPAAFTTLLTGSMLLVGALILGVTLRAITPKRWWIPTNIHD